MKKLLLSLLLVGGFTAANAQVIFFEGFQETLVPEEAVENPFDAEDDQWANYDADLLPTSAAQGGGWYTTDDVLYITAAEPGDDSNYVARSDSWLEGFAPENRNYLITPEIEIPADGMIELSWKSGVRQGPRYMDGYSVGIVTDVEDPEGSFVNLWTAAQFVADDNGWHPALYGADYDFTGCPVPGDPVDDQDFTTICYFPTVGNGLDGTGYVHAAEWTLPEYLGYENDDITSTTYVCLLEPHALSLNDYAGETIRVCILHDSDDDNFIVIDDIMVEVLDPDGVEDVDFSEVVGMYPNPAQEELNFNFTNMVTDNAIINIVDAKGAMVYSNVVSDSALRNVFTLDISAYATGFYGVSITIDNQTTVSESFIKQ